MNLPDFSEITGFNWDDGNQHKNKKKHAVSMGECEEVFFNEPIVVQQDEIHSDSEDPYFLLGKTNVHRLLFVVFTIRVDQIRIISARDMTKREKQSYEDIEKDS